MAKKVKIWQCEKCAFFRADSRSGTEGECHRNPPKVASKQKAGERRVLADVFPRVSEDNFCGEYQNKDFYKTFLET
jgi:hypothetical protein